ncbi:MAG: NAD(P) transhydrogenase subunit alpha [Gammaproteobacteria bacterium]
MPLRLAVPKETWPGEKRVALVPAIADKFAQLGVNVLIESGAGASSYFADTAYETATIVRKATEISSDSGVILHVQPPSENEIKAMKEGTVVVGMMLPFRYPERIVLMRDRNITSFAMELIPRISRAQSMDILSSQAAVAGYKAALMAADRVSGFFPMLTTAAGTIRPAKVLVIGAGVAGLQAIATAKRLGAMVEGYDVRSATREQIQSLGAKFIDTGVSADSAGGYARELTDEEKQKQQGILNDHIAAADAVITTAAIPGKPSPKIISKDTVKRMKPGAVIIDLAAEGGGNCEATKPGKQTMVNKVIIYGPLNVPSELPVHASEMYAKNILNFLTPMITEGEFTPDWEDEIVAGSLLTRDGKIVNEASREQVEAL